MKTFCRSSFARVPDRRNIREKRSPTSAVARKSKAKLSRSFLELGRAFAAWVLGKEAESLVHAANALKLGETTDRLMQMPDWNNSGLFTEEEKTALNFVQSLFVLHNEAEFQAVLRMAGKRLQRGDLLQLMFNSFAVGEWEASVS